MKKDPPWGKKVKTKFEGIRIVYPKKPRYASDGKPDFSYRIRYRHPLSGKLIEEVVGWRSEGYRLNEVRRIREELLGLIREGVVKSLKDWRKKKIAQTYDQTPTLKEFFEQKYWPHAQSKKSETTLKSEKSYWKKWIKPFLGEKRLSEITSEDLETFKFFLKKNNKTPRTIEHVLRIISAIMSYAIREKLIDKNPVHDVDLPKYDNRRLRNFTWNEIVSISKELKKRSRQTWEIFIIALFTGMRFGEICSLEYQDISLERGLIFVRNSKNRSIRLVPIHPLLFKIFADKKGKPNELIFKNKKGSKIKSIPTFYRVLRELKMNDGIKDRRLRLSFHSLRHFFITSLIEGDVHLQKAQSIAGHKTVQMTERYTHLTISSLQEEIKRALSSFNFDELGFEEES